MSIDDYLDSVGTKGSTVRLGIIATMNLGERSLAAQRVCEKRNRRKELMDLGFTYEHSLLIVRHETAGQSN